MTWTIYNNDKAWGFLSEVEKQALREHRGHSEMLGYPNGNWHTNDHTTPHDKFIYRAVPNPTPAVDADQTAQLDTANARIAELEAAYCLAMLRIGVLDGILSITNPTTEEMA
jgi:hypothetical protein